MRTLLIVWWSATGAAQALAAAASAAASAAQPEIAVRLLRCDQAGVDDLDRADAFLIVCPEMLGSAAGMMKDFFDRTYYPVLGRLAGRPYALIVSAGSDGQGAVRQIERIMSGWRLRAIAPARIICTHAQTPEAILADKHLSESALEGARELGATLAGGLALGLW